MISTERTGPIWINTRTGQMIMPLGSAFRLGVHYPELFANAHELLGAEALGTSFDVRVLEDESRRIDGFRNPDVLLRADGTDPGRYGDLKWLDPHEERGAEPSTRVVARIRSVFRQDPRILVAVIDGRDTSLSVANAQRALRRLTGSWDAHAVAVPSQRQIIVFTGEGPTVEWRAGSGFRISPP